MKNNISFRAEIIEKGNTDFIFLYACDGGVNDLIHTQPMTPECESELDRLMHQLPRDAYNAVCLAMVKRMDLLDAMIDAMTRIAKEHKRNRN
ncbi:TPA: hypothetical protein G9F27_000799 [Salmonella enterica]|uniref:Uncharacterized protein n=1 Tax=Salmonella enterica TaxID=28901 RepID=A0A743SNL0_SALER|nr:hypothetical protein [Salmonella enterica]